MHYDRHEMVPEMGGSVRTLLAFQKAGELIEVNSDG